MGEPLMIEYPGMGSGHAGNDTSRERQEREDATGITTEMQQIVFTWLHVRGATGCTAAEVEDHFLVGHGRASSALSHLHRAGHIRRIKERRQRHEVYVLPEYVDGREESPYRPRLKQGHVSELSEDILVQAIRAARMHNHISAAGLRQILKELP